MTVINVFLQKKRAIVLTDGLVYSMETGLPLGFGNKCIRVADKPIVVASRGDVHMTNGFACAFPEVYDSMDEAIADDFEAMKTIYDIHAEIKALPYVTIDAVFTGWSPSQDRPVSILVSRRDDWQPSTIIPNGDGYILPQLEGVESDNFDADMAVLPEINTCEDFNPRIHGVALMEAQRRSKQAVIGSSLPPTSIVGGHITLTEVTKTGVTQSIIHRWPDVAGEELKVAPYKPPVVVRMPTGMNRQQRRAWERQHGKVAA